MTQAAARPQNQKLITIAAGSLVSHVCMAFSLGTQ